MNIFKRNYAYTLIIAIIFAAAPFDSPAQTDDSLSQSAMRIREHVKILASDEFAGRMPGTEGIRLAADYIIKKYKEYGLEPALGSYEQKMNVVTGLKVGAGSAVSFEVVVPRPGLPEDMWKSVEKKWETGAHWMPLGFSETGLASGDLAFVGYGISSSNIGWDDYKDIDVKDKIVIALTDSPDGEKRDTEFARFTSLRYKAMNAREHGAKAIIFVKIQGDSANVFYPLKQDIAGSDAGIIAIQANRTEIAKMFPKEEPLFPLEQKLNKERKPHSFLIPRKKVNINVELENMTEETSNVVGIIPGSDAALKDEYIVIGAHYDHLGMGEYNSLWKGKPLVHNGADDNASGVAGVLEMAYRISQSPLRRSVLFISFTGEEMGLKGSNYYVNNPLVPIEQTVAMLNMDMIGRLKAGGQLNVFGTGSAAEFSEIIEKLDQQDTLLAITKGDEAFSPSDNASFYSKDIPVLFFFTGVHEDYHTPADDWDKLNYPGQKVVMDFIERSVRYIDQQDKRPEFTRVKVEIDEDRKMGRGKGAWFGIVPNFEENPHGAKISGTSAGSPAEKAVLQTDDVIVEFAGVKVKNLYDLTYALRDHAPGDEIEVIIYRDGDPEKEMKFKVTLASRK
ncbi:MAG: M28 family peptidase [Candidatus Kapaibacterium sp.]